MKNLTYIIFITLILSCKPSIHENEVHVSTMGTTGTIKYLSNKPSDFQKQIDSLLLDVNMSLSTYIDTSTISMHNKKLLSNFPYNKHFEINYNTSERIFRETNKAFNPAIMPLVSYWKVQNKAVETYDLFIDSLFIDSVVQYINMGELPDKALDFSAIAKGYGVDVVANFLESHGIENYMVEIGGEVHCLGKNIKDEYWKIAVEEPNETEQNVFEVVHLKNVSMATSGNYRNFKVLDSGQKIVHIINPKTGYPEISHLLSASIIANNCMEADAYATACMVMGLDTCFEFIMKMPNIEGYLLYSDENGQVQKMVTPGFEKYLEK